MKFLFPEIMGVAVIALLLPVLLVRALLAGHVFIGVAGLMLWALAVYFSTRFIRRRQYGLAYLPMALLLGLFFLINRISGL